GTGRGGTARGGGRGRAGRRTGCGAGGSAGRRARGGARGRGRGAGAAPTRPTRHPDPGDGEEGRPEGEHAEVPHGYLLPSVVGRRLRPPNWMREPYQGPGTPSATAARRSRLDAVRGVTARSSAANSSSVTIASVATRIAPPKNWGSCP